MIGQTARLVVGGLVLVTAFGILGASIYAAIVNQDFTRLYGWGDLVLGFLLAKVFALVAPETK
jgi:hypothetical protein